MAEKFGIICDAIKMVDVFDATAELCGHSRANVVRQGGLSDAGYYAGVSSCV